MHTLTLTDFSFITSRNITSKAVLQKILAEGAEVDFSLPEPFAGTVTCKIDSFVIAYLNRYRHEFIATQLDMGRQLFATVDGIRGKLPKAIVVIKVTAEQSVIVNKSKPVVDSGKITSTGKQPREPKNILKKVKLSPKHPLTGIGFYPHKKLDASIKLQRGKSGVYCIYNKDFKTYIGQSVDIGARWYQHLRKLNGLQHHNPNLQADWLILGPKAFVFKVIQFAEIDKLDQLEKHYIECLTHLGNVYNATPDGQGKVTNRDIFSGVDLVQQQFHLDSIASSKPLNIVELSNVNIVFTEDELTPEKESNIEKEAVPTKTNHQDFVVPSPVPQFLDRSILQESFSDYQDALFKYEMTQGERTQNFVRTENCNIVESKPSISSDADLSQEQQLDPVVFDNVVSKLEISRTLLFMLRVGSWFSHRCAIKLKKLMEPK